LLYYASSHLNQRNNSNTSQLGIPTANIPIEGLTIGGNTDLSSGIYYGWAGLSAPPSSTTAQVYPFVASIGYNPFYKNEKRSVEVHIMHDFTADFYGSHMNLTLLGFIRPEYDYVSKEKLVEDIRFDIKVAGNCLSRKGYAKFREEEELLRFEGKSEVAS